MAAIVRRSDSCGLPHWVICRHLRLSAASPVRTRNRTSEPLTGMLAKGQKVPEPAQAEKSGDDLNVDAVFAKLKTIGSKKPEEE